MVSGAYEKDTLEKKVRSDFIISIGDSYFQDHDAVAPLLRVGYLLRTKSYIDR